MICKNCGAEIEENAKFCSNCGSKTNQDTTLQNQPIEQNNIPQAKYSPKAISGFVLSLVGILIFALPMGISGLVLSCLAMKETEIPQYKGKGLAISGLVIYIFDILFGIINIVTSALG